MQSATSDKPQTDPIEKSLKLREKEGNLQSVVKNAKQPEESVFKLKLKGAIPELKSKPVDPTNKGTAASASVAANVSDPSKS